LFVQYSVAEVRAGSLVIREFMTGRCEFSSLLSLRNPTSLLYRMMVFTSAYLQGHKKKWRGLEGYRKWERAWCNTLLFWAIS